MITVRTFVSRSEGISSRLIIVLNMDTPLVLQNYSVPKRVSMYRCFTIKCRYVEAKNLFRMIFILLLTMAGKRRVGIVGYGHLGKFLVDAVAKNDDLELAFVWNRTKAAFEGSGLQKDVILNNLEDCAVKKPDLIVEVSHPIVVKQVHKVPKNCKQNFLTRCVSKVWEIVSGDERLYAGITNSFGG